MTANTYLHDSCIGRNPEFFFGIRGVRVVDQIYVMGWIGDSKDIVAAPTIIKTITHKLVVIKNELVWFLLRDSKGCVDMRSRFSVVREFVVVNPYISSIKKLGAILIVMREISSNFSECCMQIEPMSSVLIDLIGINRITLGP